jgi:molecular chaperone DnaK
MERLELNMTIDHNYVAHVDLHSTMRGHRLSAEIFDLEFTLTFPSADDHKGKSAGVDENADMSDDTTGSKALPTHTGGVCLRSNITAEQSWQKVPGDLVTQYCPSWFNERAREYSDWQKQEWVYYKDCPYCHRNRYDFRIKGCGDSKCLWKREYPTVSAVGLSRIQP